jgi:shikimate O-hydroxycinnamoyltransferase
MKVNVEVISTDPIKPSSSTPDHLLRHTLSFIDQITPSIFMPLVLFYHRDARANITTEERQDWIKKSLSEALTRFYPLAGRVKDNFHVDCNDEGVHYVEAKANCSLSEFLEDPNPAENNKFLPFSLEDFNELALAIQFTSFDCGGIAIGFLFAHKVADASSFFLFLNSFAAIARGSGDIATPRFEAAEIFPPETFLSRSPSTEGMGMKNIVIKRFVFDASAVAAIRAKYSSNDPNIEYPRPTRVEALSAFIYSRFLAATQPDADPNKICTVFHIANLRPRMEPPLSENYFGNMSVSTASVLSRDAEDGFRSIVIPVRDSIRKADMNYVKSFRESGGHSSFIRENAERLRKGEVISLAFTSLCRFPVFEADFGWGKPVWAGSGRLIFPNLVTFFDRKSGSGVEVWINLDEEDMAKFEVDKELLAHVSSPKVSAV